MSIDAQRWAWTVKTGKSAAKLVLLALADRADEKHCCYPSISRLEKDTELNRKTVMSALKHLEEAGLIRYQKRYGSTNVYKLAIGKNKKETSTKNGTGFKGEKPTEKDKSSTKNGTTPEAMEAEAEVKTSTELGTATSTNFGTSTKNGTSTNLGTRPVPKLGLTPVPILGHKPTNEPINNQKKEGVVVTCKYGGDENPPPTTKQNFPKSQSPVDDWVPSADVVDALENVHGIPAQFIAEQVIEFSAYWRDRGATATSWDSKFIQRCATEWKRHGHEWQPDPKHKTDFIEKHTDRNWAEGL